MPIVERICRTCKRTFETYDSPRHPPARYCSRRCRGIDFSRRHVGWKMPPVQLSQPGQRPSRPQHTSAES